MNAQLKAIAYRAVLTFVDAFLGVLVVGGIVQPDVSVLQQAALAGAAAAIGVARNGLALLVPQVPSTIPAPPAPAVVPLAPVPPAA